MIRNQYELLVEIIWYLDQWSNIFAQNGYQYLISKSLEKRIIVASDFHEFFLSTSTYVTYICTSTEYLKSGQSKTSNPPSDISLIVDFFIHQPYAHGLATRKLSNKYHLLIHNHFIRFSFRYDTLVLSKPRANMKKEEHPLRIRNA